MQANIESSSVTEVSLSSCANITLTDTGESINLGNSYPMSKTRALETTPYILTITSSCEDGSGYNLYLATLSTNTLSASSIHYIITEHGNQNIVVEGMLSDASDGISDFEDYDIDQLNNGINGTYGSVYRLYSSGIQYNTEVSYDLYLYIDESVTNETMGQTFVAGVAVKASDYDFATVNGVSVTEATTDSITVSVDASNGTNNISNYYYSINNGEYVSSTSNTYTFEGLDMGTTYDIKVYVVDTNGVQSNVYSVNEETSNVIYLADYIMNTVYTGTDGENGIYYHDGTGSYTNADQEAGDHSYRYSGGDYKLTSRATAEGYTTLIDSSRGETTGLIKFYDDEVAQYVGYISGVSGVMTTTYYTVAGAGSYDSYQAALDAAVNAGYITSGNINNFVCFGSDEAICPTEKLYRIIGVFDNRVKLIKYDYANTTMLGTNGDYFSLLVLDWCYSGMRNNCTTTYTYGWNYTNTEATFDATNYYNVWSYSALNTVNLNTNYLNYLGETWASKIATTNWKVGGTTYANIYSSPAKPAYTGEIVNTNGNVETEYSAKIGLMYTNDYGYATDPSNWTTNLESYNGAVVKSSNWMYMGYNEWTISRRSDETGDVFYVSSNGSMNVGSAYGSGIGVRPSFYLEPSVVLTGGTGTASDPYRIA